MTVAYDKYYKTGNLFVNPYPELLAFFGNFPNKGKVLDMGSGQGRNAIPIARLGFEVIGIDTFLKITKLDINQRCITG